MHVIRWVAERAPRVESRVPGQFQIISFFVFFETRGIFTFTTGVCSRGGRGDPPETLNGLTRNPLSSKR